MTKLRMPSITAQSEREQLIQIKNYLYALIPELQWALDSVGTQGGGSPAGMQRTVKIVENKSQNTDESAEVAFTKLKPLIIKSADIVQAYYDRISEKLSGTYIAKSEFGEFEKRTEADFTKTSERIDLNFKNYQEIKSDYEDGVAKIKAWITTGNLETDDSGIDVYGIEIGQKTEVNGVETFNKFARFTASRLSFYDQNGNEAAYISDRTLYINEMQALTRFKMGGFEDTLLSNGDVITRWVGKD